MCCLSKTGKKLRFTNTEHRNTEHRNTEHTEPAVSLQSYMSLFGRREILQEEWEDHSSEGYLVVPLLASSLNMLEHFFLQVLHS